MGAGLWSWRPPRMPSTRAMRLPWTMDRIFGSCAVVATRTAVTATSQRSNALGVARKVKVWLKSRSRDRRDHGAKMNEVRLYAISWICCELARIARVFGIWLVLGTNSLQGSGAVLAPLELFTHDAPVVVIVAFAKTSTTPHPHATQLTPPPSYSVLCTLLSP